MMKRKLNLPFSIVFSLFSFFFFLFVAIKKGQQIGERIEYIDNNYGNSLFSMSFVNVEAVNDVCKGLNQNNCENNKDNLCVWFSSADGCQQTGYCGDGKWNSEQCIAIGNRGTCTWSDGKCVPRHPRLTYINELRDCNGACGGRNGEQCDYCGFSGTCCTNGQSRQNMCSFNPGRQCEHGHCCGRLPGTSIGFAPTMPPTNSPTFPPTHPPTHPRTNQPTNQPTKQPTLRPTPQPTPNPTKQPTQRPTPNPTKQPTQRPTPNPTKQPTQRPTDQPTLRPTFKPTLTPTRSPETLPPNHPPTTSPTFKPTNEPTAQPTVRPTVRPTLRPTANPTNFPTITPLITQSPTPPTNSPTKQPTFNPTKKPTQQPTRSPTDAPTAHLSSFVALSHYFGEIDFDDNKHGTELFRNQICRTLAQAFFADKDKCGTDIMIKRVRLPTEALHGLVVDFEVDPETSERASNAIRDTSVRVSYVDEAVRNSEYEAIKALGESSSVTEDSDDGDSSARTEEDEGNNSHILYYIGGGAAGLLFITGLVACVSFLINRETKREREYQRRRFRRQRRDSARPLRSSSQSEAVLPMATYVGPLPTPNQQISPRTYQRMQQQNQFDPGMSPLDQPPPPPSHSTRPKLKKKGSSRKKRGHGGRGNQNYAPQRNYEMSTWTQQPSSLPNPPPGL